MEQFQRKDSHHSDRQGQNLFGFLSRVFGGGRAAAHSSDLTTDDLSHLQLPARDLHDALSPPSFLKLESTKGEPTLVSVRHEPCQEACGGEQVHVAARQNFGGARHQLEYVLITAQNEDRILKGSVSEVGRLPMVPGSYAPERPRVLIRFHIAAPRNSKGESLWLSRDAWNLVEAFVERGLWGVDQQLATSVRLIGLSHAHVHRSRRFKQECTEKNEATEAQPFAPLEDEPSDYYTEDPAHYEVYEDIRDSIRLLAALSIDELELQKGFTAVELHEFGTSRDDDDDVESYKGPPGVRVSEKWFSRSIHAEFFTPGEEGRAGVLLRLVVPFTRSDKEAKLGKLHLEILGPRAAFGLRERFRIRDCNDTLAVHEFSYNDELFRNLFRTFHHVNSAAIANDAKLEGVLNLLEQYGLYPKAANPLALLGSLRRRRSTPSRDTQQEQVEPD